MLCFVYSILISILVVSSCEENVLIDIPQGRLSGITNVTPFSNRVYHSFRGIPYAESPTGELRFQPPKPHRGWESTYKAHVNKATCLQFSTRMRNGEAFGLSGSEDCLYLNIHTSTLLGNQPVVVFDYNDDFKTGFNETTYRPDLLVEQNTVVVTINHRLGVLGYLTTEDGVIKGNNGIKDFIQALKWIKENIKHFGGDPNNVSLMGSRGGAILINLLLYTEKASGLFHKVILQSGTAIEPIWFSSSARKHSFKLGELLNITAGDSNTLLKQLRDISAEDLIKNALNVADHSFTDKYQISVLPFSPVIDDSDDEDAIIKSLPEDSKIVNDVPILIGFNSRDGLDIILPYVFEPRLLQDMTYDNFFMHFPIRTNFRFDRNETDYSKVIQEIWHFYFKGGKVNPNSVYEYAKYMGDILQNYALNYAAKKIANEIKSSVYYYMFDFRGVLNENSEYMSRKSRMKHWGATIGDELCYLTICGRIEKTYNNLRKLYSEQPETKVSKKMVRMWTNFMKTGNPTPNDDDSDILKNIKWLPLNKDIKETNYLHIGRKTSMRSNPLGDREEFWDQFLDKYSRMDNGVVKHVKDEL